MHYSALGENPLLQGPERPVLGSESSDGSDGGSLPTAPKSAWVGGCGSVQVQRYAKPCQGNMLVGAQESHCWHWLPVVTVTDWYEP